MINQDYKNKIIKLLDNFNYRKSRIQVFNNAVEYDALKLAVLSMPFETEKRKARMTEIEKDYKGNDKTVFDTICKTIFEMLANMIDDYGDYLGSIYIDIDAGNKNSGQFFTPYHISHFMACINLADKPSEDKILTINEPCCGSGGMVVAMTEVLMREHKFNYTSNALAIAGDIDKQCVYMAYLQISFTGLPAVIRHENSLTMECWDTFLTPAFVLQYPKFNQKLKEMTK